MRVVALSDTHGLHGTVDVPPGDLVIFAGDACSYGTGPELIDFARWWNALPHRWKVFVPGNHDWPCFYSPAEAAQLMPRTHYLVDRALDLEVDDRTVRIYGSPWQPEFCDWAFNLPRRGPELKRRWDAIPRGLDVLVTHGPPYGVLDIPRWPPSPQGCELLRDAVLDKAPRVMVCGHIHESGGKATLGDTEVYNVCVLDQHGRLDNRPLVLEL